MKIIKAFKNNELLTFTENNKIKISIDDNYDKFNIKKGYKINLLNSNKGSYKGSFMNNYICKKFKSNQKLNLINIETNKILNYCKYFLLSNNEYFNYFLLSDNEYINYFNKNVVYDYYWLLRSPYYDYTHYFTVVYNNGYASGHYASNSSGFVPFFTRKKIKK